MDTLFENRFSTIGDTLLKSELTKPLKLNTLLDLSKIVLDHDISNEERQNLLFKDVFRHQNHMGIHMVDSQVQKIL